jgi:hypothetical protein
VDFPEPMFPSIETKIALQAGLLAYCAIVILLHSFLIYFKNSIFIPKNKNKN